MRILALILATASLLAAQAFEVASIRPAKDDGNQDIDTDRGRFVAHNLTLKRLIGRAWDIDESEVLGGPAWIDSDTYDINAKIPGSDGQWTREKVLNMLQSLLADRFQLAVHRETRQVSGYVLAVAKTGPKMTPAKPGPDDSNTSSNGTYLKATNVTMELLARRLSRNRDIGKVVVDKTGLTGKFDFELEWAPAQAETDDHAGIFTALQEQLGLKLESAKVPVEAVVIDRAEKPSEN
jgi:uncharacterized protein (TIGR03435 family)